MRAKAGHAKSSVSRLFSHPPVAGTDCLGVGQRLTRFWAAVAPLGLRGRSHVVFNRRLPLAHGIS